MAPIVSTTPATTCPPRVAVPAADEASWLAWRALSALCRTVLVSCSMAAAVCCSELACSSVREDRSWLPASISFDAVAMLSVPARTRPTTCARLVFMSLSACSNCPVSSPEVTVT